MTDPLANLESADDVIRALYALVTLRKALEATGDAKAFAAGCTTLQAHGFDVLALGKALDATPETMRQEALDRYVINGYLVAGGAPWLRARTVIASEVMKDRGAKDNVRRALADGKWSAVLQVPETENPHEPGSECFSEWSRGYRRTLAIVRRAENPNGAG